MRSVSAEHDRLSAVLAALPITLSVSDFAAEQNSQSTITVQITNSGTTALTGVTVSLPFQPEAFFVLAVGAIIPVGVAGISAFADIPAGQTVTATYTAQATATVGTRAYDAVLSATYEGAPVSITASASVTSNPGA